MLITKKISLHSRIGYIYFEIDCPLEMYQKIVVKNITDSNNLFKFKLSSEYIYSSIFSGEKKIYTSFQLPDGIKFPSEGQIEISGLYEIYEPKYGWNVYIKKYNSWDDNPYGIEFIKTTVHHKKLTESEIESDKNLLNKLKKMERLKNKSFPYDEEDYNQYVFKLEPVTYTKISESPFKNKIVNFKRDLQYENYIFDGLNNVKSIKINNDVYVRLVIDGYYMEIEAKDGICFFDFVKDYEIIYKSHRMWINDYKQLFDKIKGLNMDKVNKCFIKFYPNNKLYKSIDYDEIEVTIELA